MTIQQVSVFVENKVGSLTQLINLFAENDVNLQAISIAETQEYGIVRLIVKDTEKATALLKKEGWVHTVTDVLAVNIANEPGALAKVLDVLVQAGVGVEYAYSFLARESGRVHMVLRVTDNAKAEPAFAQADIVMIDQAGL